MKTITGFRGMRVLAAFAALAVNCTPALAELSARAPECPSEPVTIWYADNPQASGWLYSNPWANCKPANLRCALASGFREVSPCR